MAQKTSVIIPNLRSSPSKSSRGNPNSPDSSSSDSKSTKPFDRKPSIKSSSASSSSFSLTEKKAVRVSEMQQQLNLLQDELKKMRDEKSRVLKELAEAKKMVSAQNSGNDGLKLYKDRIEFLELEVEKTKDSERKMLESMISQTKLLEQTKISLEEAKLEIRSLKESLKNSESLVNGSGTEEKDIMMLRNELKSAMAAEEKSKKAMDDLAIALKEVTTEMNQVKEKLLITETELDNARVDAHRSKNQLKSVEEKYQAAVEESERLRFELEETVAAWNAKEDGFIDCMKVSEEEISKGRQENDKLIDSQRVVRDENAKLRDILKQAVNEASVVKETLEIVRNENSHLKDMIAEKENVVQKIKQDYDSLKVSEAAALGSVNELKGLLAATASTGSFESRSFRQTRVVANDDKINKSTTKFLSDRWKGDNLKIQNGRRHSIGEPGKFKGPAFDARESPEYERDRMFASISNISDWKVPSSIVTDDTGTLSLDGYDHLDASDNLKVMENDSLTSANQKKKKTMFRKFGEMIRRRSFHK
ncbi:WEB family protein At3g02930, chloroplastic-like [Dioscorea cayenensis subsp. rotundata]|uniref:WEB family protein At3g02930, chloroplastic-like n=1 Tax=Dioscorea cayennensis subsp. rotundata TaxID=55577 RepID=A0AB40CZ11_DIOCR|nr:WEB family protein At3g02930, chloroplastic-like [Dioscorea cayenensis subsp. rotundata]